MPYDSPLAAALRQAAEKAEERRKAHMVDDTLRLVDPNWEGG